MGIFSKIFGEEQAPSQGRPMQQAFKSEDEQALERYRYMLKTAPPETIEQAHAEAFARLTPQQRQLLLEHISAEVPAAERAAAAGSGGDSPQALARMATRAELRQPGTMERTFGGIGGGARGGIGLGGLMAGSFLSTIAGAVVGSMIANQFFSHQGAGADTAASADGDATQNTDHHASDDSGFDSGDTGDVADMGDIGDGGGFSDV